MLRENLPHLATRASERADLPAIVRWLPTGFFKALVRWGAGHILGSLNTTELVECQFRRLSDAVFVEGAVERVALLKIGARIGLEARTFDAERWTHSDALGVASRYVQTWRAPSSTSFVASTLSTGSGLIKWPWR